MKKKIKSILLLSLVVAVIGTGFVIAFADQENNIDLPHEHEYQITAFDRGEITLTCEICGEAYTEDFAEHLNERDNDMLDLNDDGIVNGKDYAYLNQQY